MKKIGLLSDTHHFVHPQITEVFKDCDEIWHAGDMGDLTVAAELEKIAFLRAVYGNIDGHEIRISYPEYQLFEIEGLKVFMIHIGGYPGRYSPKARSIIGRESPRLFISGHSHILKVAPDRKNRLLHINPGAAGKSGLHKVITMVRFEVQEGRVQELDVIEFPRKSE